MAAESCSHGAGQGYRLSRKIVQHHNTLNDAWVIVDNGVYDVTMFLELHPGGVEILKDQIGKDVSEVMRADSPHSHGPAAFKMLERYRVGFLPNEEASVDSNINPKTGKQYVDWNKAILPQIGAMGESYDSWVHSFPTADHTVQLFQNPIIESLTKCPWYYPLVFWIPILSYYAVDVFFKGQTLPSFLLCLICGYLFWLSFEYSLHRFIFHMKTSNYFMNILHFLIHGHHHITPMDGDRLVFPPAPAVLIVSPLWLALPLLFGHANGYSLLVGFGIGYLAYDMTHYWIHHVVPENGFLKAQKSRHIHHHYFSPDANFGISNPLFDVICSTLAKPKQA